MLIKSLKKLPVGAKNMWESTYKEASKKYSEERAAKIAWEVVKRNYKGLGKTAKKSMVMPSTTEGTVNGNFIDVLVGYPAVDKQGVYQGTDFWKYASEHSNILKGDMEHYYKNKAEGLYVDDSEDSVGWVPMADSFKMSEDGSVYARVEIPENHPFTPTFLQGWESGKYGVSVEYAFPEEAEEYTWVDGKLVPSIKQGILTGFSFTEDPAFEKTKNNSK